MRQLGATMLLAVASTSSSSPMEKPIVHAGSISIAPTNADLSLAPSSLGQILRTGYYSAGDVSPLLYTASTKPCSRNGGSGDGGEEVSSADGKCWIARFPEGQIPLLQYGLRCDGSAKDIAIIETSIKGAIDRGQGAHVLFPAGICPLASTINVGTGSVYFSGEGSGVTILRVAGAFDAFHFFGHAFDGGVSRLRIESAQRQPRAGYAFHTDDGVGAIEISDVRVEGTFGGLLMTNPAVTGVVKIRDVHFSNLSSVNDSDTVKIEGASQLFVRDVDSYQEKPNRSCLHFLDISAAYLSNVTCGGSRTGLLIDPPSGEKVFDIFASNVEIDNSQGVDGGLVVDSLRGGAIWGLRLSNIRVGFGSGPGIIFRGPRTSFVTLENFSSERNLSSGLVVDGLGDSQVTDGQLLGNGAGGQASLGLDLRQADRVTFSRLRATASYPGQSASAQEVGIALSPSLTGSIQIEGGDVSGNTKAGMINRSIARSVVVDRVSGAEAERR